MGTAGLCFSTFSSSSLSSLSLSNQISSSSSPLPPRSSLLRPLPPSRAANFAAKASNSGNFVDDDSFGFYPWDSTDGDSGISWVPEDTITLFTADGLVQIGGSTVPRRVTSSDKTQGKVKTSPRFQRFQESDYMDPAQGLCLGALFDIAATNGLDMGRRLCIIGFCRSIEMLSDVVEDTVLEHGGELGLSSNKLKFVFPNPSLSHTSQTSAQLECCFSREGQQRRFARKANHDCGGPATLGCSSCF